MNLSRVRQDQGHVGETPDVPLVLPRPPGIFRRFWAAHPRLVDGAVALVALVPPSVVAAVLLAPQSDDEWVGNAWFIAVSGLLCSASLLVRRAWPLIPVSVCAVLLAIPLGFSVGPSFAVYFALYAVGAYASARLAWVSVGAASIGDAIGRFSQSTTSVNDPLGTSLAMAFALATYVVAMLLGSSTRSRQAYVQQLIARAEDLSCDREREASLAVAAERARIAREMHDVVSHGLTVMTTLADGSARLIDLSPQRAREGMLRVGETGRESLAEMRRLLGVLREPGDGSDRTPQPTASDLSSMVASFRSAGLPVQLTTSGRPSDAPHVGLAVHRIVQEALTNVVRHAADAREVRVKVEHGADAVRIEITDNGRGATAATTGAGRGLVGIRERVALFSGTVEAGPMQSGGWRLAATLPIASRATEEAPA